VGMHGCARVCMNMWGCAYATWAWAHTAYMRVDVWWAGVWAGVWVGRQLAAGCVAGRHVASRRVVSMGTYSRQLIGTDLLEMISMKVFPSSPPF